jgi:hypothetical protein
MFSRVIGITFLSAALIGCTTESNEDEEKSIEGSWLWPCIQLSDQSSYIITEEYDGGAYTGVVRGYATTDCSGGEQSTYTGTGTYTVGDAVTSDNTPALQANKIDFVFTNVVTTGDAGINAELENWYAWQTSPNLFDLFFFDSESDKLYFADYSTGDATSDMTRPNKIDLSIAGDRLDTGS